MSIVDLLRPRWLHHDPEVRFAAVKALKNVDILAEVARNDHSPKVRYAALEKLDNEELIEKIAINCNCHETALAALKKIRCEDTIFLVAVKAKDLTIRNAAIGRLESQRFLLEVLKNCHCLSTCVSAMKKISDTVSLEEVLARNNLKSQVRLAVQDRIRHLKTG
ncbi:MAG: HEAT repeat domain-containing protein [Victivallaceae bacterium]|nr:HEAT repeat domain-containing protein [Victivallaceae bacterium]